MTRIFSKLVASLVAGSLMIFALAASAQSPLSGGFDTDQPIEILADSLEVQQEKQIATFAGNVQVIQGEIRLKAAKLEVHYAQNNSKAKTDNGEDPPNIRRINAYGDVFLSSPRETAKGDQGVYNVIDKKIQLQGNVVLTQGQNVLRGQKMTLDLVSGKSRIDGGGTSSGGGRVRGIFVPEKKK